MQIVALSLSLSRARYDLALALSFSLRQHTHICGNLLAKIHSCVACVYIYMYMHTLCVNLLAKIFDSDNGGGTRFLHVCVGVQFVLPWFRVERLGDSVRQLETV